MMKMSSLDEHFSYNPDNKSNECFFSKGDKSICFVISESEIKCFMIWASIELDHYGCVEVSDYDKPQLWKWLEEE